MIRISLTEEERAGLARLRLERKSNVGEHAHYVLLAASGMSAPEISRHLNRNIITIRLWLNRYVKERISGLTSHKSPGRPAKKAPMIEIHLEELLSKSPRDYGYQEAGWQLNLLRDFFEKNGCKACDNTLVKSLNKLGYVYKRFSKAIPQNAPTPIEKKEKVGEIVERIKQEPQEDIEILFLDESHFSNQPYVSRGWFKCGKKTVNTVKNRLSKTLFGALNLRTSKFYWKQADIGNSQQFIMFLHQLHQARPDKKLIIILDNGSIHKSKKVKKFVSPQHVMYGPRPGCQGLN